MAWRPTTAAPTSSARPVSSFCRVCRTTAIELISATSTAVKLNVSVMVMDPAVGSATGPLNTRATALPALDIA